MSPIGRPLSAWRRLLVAGVMAVWTALLWQALAAYPALAQGRLPISQQTDDPTLWYVTRGAAATAYVLLSLSVALGITVSMRTFDGIARAWRILDLHQVISLLMIAFVVLHLATLLLDPSQPFTVLQLAWPFAETYRPLWVALGVLGLYLVAAVLATSWLRRTIGTRVWRAVHQTSYAAFVVLTLHGLLSGTDTRTPWMLGVYCAACALVVWLTAARIILGRHPPLMGHAGLPAVGRLRSPQPRR